MATAKVIDLKCFKLGSINLNKSHTAASHFTKLMEEMDLALVQEPPLKGAKNQNKMVTGFSTLPVIAYGVNARACIVRKKEIKMIPVAHISTKDMAVGLWTTPSNDKIVVCSAYFPFDGEIDESIQDLEKVREYANTKG